MSKSSDTPKRPRINRFEISINVVIQTILVLFIVGVINFAGYHYYKTWDVSRDKKRALSEKTLQVLKTIPPELKVYAFYSPQDPLIGDVETLLKDLRSASGNKLNVEFINQYAAVSRAEELRKQFQQFKFGQTASAILIECKGKAKLLDPNEMTEWDRSGELFGNPGRPTAFKGEQLVTSALIEVSEEKQRKVYFLSGHGESEVLTEPNYEVLRVYLTRENIKTEKLNLQDASKIPDDCSALMIIGPRFDLTEREIELMKGYWKNKGRLMVLLNPDGQTTRLDQYLSGIGIQPDDNRLYAARKSQEVSGMFLLETNVIGGFTGNSPVTKSIENTMTSLPAPAKSLTLHKEVIKTQNTRLTALFMSAQAYWGEVDYKAKQDEIQFNEGKDVTGPLCIIAQGELGASGDDKVQLDTSRIIVAGNALFIDDRIIRGQEQFLYFTTAAVNWLTNREELIGVPPKELKTFDLHIEGPDMIKILLFIFMMPFLAALAGFAVWWRRRN